MQVSEAGFSRHRVRYSGGDDDGINFGPVPPGIDRLLQQGVLAYRDDPGRAEALFCRALREAPEELPVYLCLYKIYAYGGDLNRALVLAEAGFIEAARQAGRSNDIADWEARPVPSAGPERFALYTLKALAFIHLRRGEPASAGMILDQLARLDPQGQTGWPVIADLARHG